MVIQGSANLWYLIYKILVVRIILAWSLTHYMLTVLSIIYTLHSTPGDSEVWRLRNEAIALIFLVYTKWRLRSFTEALAQFPA